jgi:hypothetical protein
MPDRKSGDAGNANPAGAPWAASSNFRIPVIETGDAGETPAVAPKSKEPMPTRSFTPDELDELDIPYRSVAGTDEIVDQSRWMTHHRAICEVDGKFYEFLYQRGSTEMQDGEDQWYDEDPIVAREVELREVTVKQWLPVEDA